MVKPNNSTPNAESSAPRARVSIRLIAGCFTGLIYGLLGVAAVQPNVQYAWLAIPLAMVIGAIVFLVAGDDIGSFYRWLYGGRRRRK